jgi:DNA-directed RNA polymerase specialized sigma24 family protein
MAVADVATAMDCAEGTVRALLHQARERLAKALANELEDQR